MGAVSTYKFCIFESNTVIPDLIQRKYSQGKMVESSFRRKDDSEKRKLLSRFSRYVKILRRKLFCLDFVLNQYVLKTF